VASIVVLITAIFLRSDKPMRTRRFLIAVISMLTLIATVMLKSRYEFIQTNETGIYYLILYICVNAFLPQLNLVQNLYIASFPFAVWIINGNKFIEGIRNHAPVSKSLAFVNSMFLMIAFFVLYFVIEGFASIGSRANQKRY
jgi:hypothetical protein